MVCIGHEALSIILISESFINVFHIFLAPVREDLLKGTPSVYKNVYHPTDFFCRLRFKGKKWTNFVRQCVMVRMNLYPSCVTFRGPIKSIPTMYKRLLILIGLSCGALSSFFLGDGMPHSRVSEEVKKIYKNYFLNEQICFPWINFHKLIYIYKHSKFT